MGESLLQHEARVFSLEERFEWKTDEEFQKIETALAGAVEKDMVLLAVNGQPFQCHQCVLSAACPFFEAMFKSGMKECRGEVKLQFPGDVLEVFLLYLYQGQLKVTESTFEHLFFMAHLFQLRGALAFMTDLLSSSTERDNALELFNMAINFDIPQLRFSVIDYLLSMSISELRFEEFPFALMLALLDKDDLRVEREGRVVEIIFAWIHHDPNERERHKDQLLQCVRLPHLRLSELESWHNEGIGSLGLLKTLSESVDWLQDVTSKMLTKRTYSDIHLHGFWAEDSLCEYSFEIMRQRNVDQPLWTFDTSQYSIVCSSLGSSGHGKQELTTCNQDYLSCTSMDGLIIREDWTKRPCFPVGPDLHISYHDTLRRAADFKGGWGSPNYDLAFLKMPLALNGLQSRRGQCKRRSFNFEYFKSRICCATEYKKEIVFVVGAFTEAEDDAELFFIRICRFNPSIEAHFDDDVECLTDEIELFKEYMPICCVVTQNDKLAVLSAHDIKIFDLSDTSQTDLEYSISLEFEIGISAWVKDDIIYVYLVDRLKNVFDKGEEEEPPKMHYISAYSVNDGFDKIFQHELDFAEKNIGYPKDVRSFIVRNTIYIIYKAIPQYKVPSEEGLYIYRYDIDFQTLVKLDRFEVIRLAKNDRFPTKSVVYEKDLVALVPTDMIPCLHSTLLEDFCHRYSLDTSCDFSKLAKLRQYQL